MSYAPSRSPSSSRQEARGPPSSRRQLILSFVVTYLVLAPITIFSFPSLGPRDSSSKNCFPRNVFIASCCFRVIALAIDQYSSRTTWCMPWFASLSSYIHAVLLNKSIIGITLSDTCMLHTICAHIRYILYNFSTYALNNTKNTYRGPCTIPSVRHKMSQVDLTRVLRIVKWLKKVSEMWIILL